MSASEEEPVDVYRLFDDRIHTHATGYTIRTDRKQNCGRVTGGTIGVAPGIGTGDIHLAIQVNTDEDRETIGTSADLTIQQARDLAVTIWAAADKHETRGDDA